MVDKKPKSQPIDSTSDPLTQHCGQADDWSEFNIDRVYVLGDNLRVMNNERMQEGHKDFPKVWTHIMCTKHIQ